MPVGRQRGNASAWRALQIALLNQVGLNHIFNGFTLFANARRYVVQPYRAAVEAVNQPVGQSANAMAIV
jgi:hypothetical protein